MELEIKSQVLFFRPADKQVKSRWINDIHIIKEQYILKIFEKNTRYSIMDEEQLQIWEERHNA